jgi:catechol 2,3-dioxygenase-like lactoylglutathione lyase family enzyme
MAILTWLGVPGTSEAWAALGFEVADGTVTVGRVVHEIGCDPSWGFHELGAEPSTLGVITKQVPPAQDAAKHPNLIERIDHIVYAVPELDPAVEALTAVLGEPPRRRAFPRGPDGPEMAFFTVGDSAFIEVVASGRPPALWGIAFVSNDLDTTVTAVREAGGPVGDPKPAVQGGRIASVWKGHVGWGIAIMEPPTREGRHG